MRHCYSVICSPATAVSSQSQCKDPACETAALRIRVYIYISAIKQLIKHLINNCNNGNQGEKKNKNQSSVPLFLPLVRLAIKSTIMKREVTPHKRGAPYGWRKDGRSVGRASSIRDAVRVCPPDPLCCVFRAQRANSIRHQWLRNSGSDPLLSSVLVQL